jgi:formiminotetrahydrofolate cyclodeaminase
VEEAMHGATEVPLQVLERASAMLARMEALQIPARYASDLAVGKALTAAAKTGAMENVRINLESIQDEKFRVSIEARLGALKT